MMNRRDLLKAGALALPLISAAKAQEIAKRSNGLPPLTIKDVKVITTNGGSHYHWVFLKIITSEPGLYGVGSANDDYQVMAVIADLEDHLKPWLIGKDPDRIEDLWQSAQMRTYWRNGPINNNVLSAMDMALWDIKAKRAGMPLYELFGGKARDAVAVYDHQGGKTKEECLACCSAPWLMAIPTSGFNLAATAAAATSPPDRAIDRKAVTRDRPSISNNMSMPFHRSLNICANKLASVPNSCTTSTLI